MENEPSSDTQRISDRLMRLLPIVGILMVIFIVAAVSGYTWVALFGPCSVSTVETASIVLLDQLQRFDAIYQSTATLTPVELFDPMTELEQILIDTQAMVVPACMQIAHIELVSFMETLIRALLAVMESKPESTSTGFLEKSNTHRDNFTAELEWINKCAPFCP